jgi:hypothetical protein
LADPNTKIDAIARALREYCALHPHAADTIEGVRGWLPAEHQSIARSELTALLEVLVSERTLTRRTLADGTIVYFSGAPSSGSA